MPLGRADLYHVQGVVWTGEVAEICRAVAPNGSLVAIKRLKPRLPGRRAAARALHHEADVGLHFDHPNVIKVVEFISYPAPVMVMEYFPSRNLKVRILDPRGDELLTFQTREIIRQMADALLHIHDHGYIHMDLKPENYLLNDNARIKLTDFAIATQPVTGWRRVLSAPRRIAGTRPYIAPETLRRKLPDFRTDIYSFGCTLYEILTGRPPFISVDRDHLLAMHLRIQPAFLTTYNRNLTEDVNELVMLMLEKDPGRRPQSMQDVKARLERILLFRKPPERKRKEEEHLL